MKKFKDPMTNAQIKARIMELEKIIRDLDAQGKVDEYHAACEEQAELASMIGMTEI
jgi:hypothetical protein